MDDEPIFLNDDPPAVQRPGRLTPGPNFPVNTMPGETIQFRFRTRMLIATAFLVNDVRSNVVRLQLQASFLQSILQTVLGYLPRTIHAWFESWFPEWTLPPHLILKKQKKNWGYEFEAEKAAYAKLRPLQGTVVPKLFGELEYDDTRALLMSDTGGACLASPEAGMLELDEFRRLLRQTFTALSCFGVLQDDLKLDNFRLTDGRVMAIDLEMTSNYENQPILTDEQLEFDITLMVDFLAEAYEENQYRFWEDGILSVGVE